MGLKAFTVVVGTAALMGVGAGAAVACPASLPSPTSPTTWRLGMAPVAGETSAVTGVRAGGTTTEFAFVYDYSRHSMFARVNGGSWKLEKGPGLAKGEMVVAAKAITASRLVLFTTSLANRTSRVLADNAGKWVVLRKFGLPIGTASVLSPGNIWVFGSPNYNATKPLGVFHYDGKTWKRVASSGYNGGGVSATSAWTVKGAVVEHLSGGTTTATSLAPLIPQGGKFGTKSLIGVYPISGSAAYAVGTGGDQGAGGPLVVLKYNGHNWKRVASYPGGIVPVATDVASDGKGGLLIGGEAGAGGKGMLLHYAKGSGKLVKESVTGMTNVPRSEFLTVANVPGTTVNILGGLVPAAETLTGSKATLYTSN